MQISDRTNSNENTSTALWCVSGVKLGELTMWMAVGWSVGDPFCHEPIPF